MTWAQFFDAHWSDISAVLLLLAVGVTIKLTFR